MFYSLSLSPQLSRIDASYRNPSQKPVSGTGPGNLSDQGGRSSVCLGERWTTHDTAPVCIHYVIWRTCILQPAWTVIWRFQAGSAQICSQNLRDSSIHKMHSCINREGETGRNLDQRFLGRKDRKGWPNVAGWVGGWPSEMFAHYSGTLRQRERAARRKRSR